MCGLYRPTLFVAGIPVEEGSDLLFEGFCIRQPEDFFFESGDARFAL